MMVIMDIRKCNCCDEIKPIDEFYVYFDRRTNRAKRKGSCKQCYRDRDREYKHRLLELGIKKCIACRQIQAISNFTVYKGSKTAARCNTCKGVVPTKTCVVCGATKAEKLFHGRKCNTCRNERINEKRQKEVPPSRQKFSEIRGSGKNG